MTYFKINIPKLNESVSRYRNIKNNCLEDLSIVYRGLGYTESAWNDPNAYTFIEKTKKDKYKSQEYFNYLDNLYNEIDQFKNNIDYICSRQGYRRNSIVLKFDDGSVNACKNNLNNSIAYLNDCLNRININDFDSNFLYRNSIYNLKSEIKQIRNSIQSLEQEINNFVNSINNELNNSRYRVKRVGSFDLNLKPIEYRWQIKDMDVKEINMPDPQRDVNVKETKLNNKVADVTLSKVHTIGVNATKFSTVEMEEIKGLNNNVNLEIANENKIKFQSDGKIQGLNDNISDVIANKNDIKFESDKEIGNLNNNINQSNVNLNDIKFDINNKGIDINNNVETFKANDNSIDYNINTEINLKNGITTAEVKQNNIDTSNIVSNNYDLNSDIESAKVNSKGIESNINNSVNLDMNIKKMESLNELNK